MHLSADMGPFAVWVWPAYGCTVLVFVINYLIALHEQRALRKKYHAEDPKQ